MKVKVLDRLFDQIRSAIRDCEINLNSNKSKRKDIIREIRVMKNNIRQGESLCSKLEVGLIVDPAYIRDDLQKKRQALNDLRTSLIGQEISHDVELAKFRALHRQLDKMKVPFDPEAFAKARSK